ncbi:hypothetical protein Golax_015058 [Gossypium laxum]|uniref:Uncharacterized protein n=1 Tax=Gossypium laxum TaxID=34288 RepID=A0A7J8ZWL8_9ROSI|nr:hypothetical protein [Gossypium laxum]
MTQSIISVYIVDGKQTTAHFGACRFKFCGKINNLVAYCLATKGFDFNENRC